MPSPTNVPASLSERLADAEGELPEEIAKAIEVFDKVVSGRTKLHQRAGGPTCDYDIADAAYDTARDALTATILACLTAAESAREAAVAERDQAHKSFNACIADRERGGTSKRVYSDAALGRELEDVEAARDAALARAERAEKALAPFADFVSTLEQQVGDGRPVVIGGYGRHRKMLTAGDIRRAALAHPATAEET